MRRQQDARAGGQRAGAGRYGRVDDAALIEEQEESDDDVTDIIGDREDNEEEP